MMTALMKSPATREPTILKTMVKGEVLVFLVLRPGYVYGTLSPINRTERILFESQHLHSVLWLCKRTY